MPVADMTVATPSPGAAGQAILQEGDRQVDSQLTRIDVGQKIGYQNDVYQNRTLPQLQSGMGATGQWYSSAAEKNQLNAAQDVKQGNFDVISAASRHLDTLTRQRMYASVGLIV